ncbi:FGGY family carbohydrate kinase [Demequina aestuarii]|uniref:FGGY family carbohydrate kinase n=1 Tax=Demequina aestuarii TaxID=327095 RepID=UPI000783A96B|nr:FGGY family carbohydrate kinase [Demequina aestuarii]
MIVGVDFGSSRIKAAGYTRDGRLVAESAVPTPLLSGSAGDDFPVARLVEAAGMAIRGLRRQPGSIVGMGLTSMGEVGSVIGPDGLAELAFPSWYDSRGTEVIARLEREHGARALRDATGRHLRLTSTVAKLGHVAERDGGVPSGTFVGVCGALAWMLTGEAWQEAGLAATSGVWDLLGGDYLLDVWESAGLGGVDLAQVRGPGEASRAVTDTAREWGLAPGAPVVIAGHDHPVASVGAGAVPGDLVDSMGTGEAIIAVMRGDDAASRARSVEVLDLDPLLSLEVWPATAEPLVVWERMRPGLAMRTFLDHADIPRDVLDASAPPPQVPLSFDDNLSRVLEGGLRAPVTYDAATWGELVDFYVLLANRGQELVRTATGSSGVVVLTGGGLRSPRWRTAKAVLGSGPMEVSTVRETATRGCAAMAGLALGWWDDPSEMPGADRVPVAVGDCEAIERASALLA